MKLQAPALGQAWLSIPWEPPLGNLASCRGAHSLLDVTGHDFSRSPTLPETIGPPVTNQVGRFRRAAAIERASTILSQLHNMTSPSNWLAPTMSSIEAAIT